MGKALTGGWLGLLFSILMGLNTASAAVTLPEVKPVVSCEQLAAMDFSSTLGDKVTINSATLEKTTAGTFCEISATVAPSIGMKVALPAEKWTQRFLQVGCGGLCGSINLSLSNANGCVPAMNGEFAVAATDMGHSGSMMDGSWAEDPQKRIDFAYRANHLTAVLSKALIQAFYGQTQKYAYFMGCSDGGREALMEAQRYPDDFNGITAGAPAAFFQFQNSFYHGGNVEMNQRKDGSSILLQDRLPILHQAVMAHCPTQSGVKDGLLENPWACTFSDDWVKVCSAQQKEKSDCLTQEELDVAKKLYGGAADADGNQFVTGGLPLGSELKWPVPATQEGRSMSEMMVLPALQYVLLPEANAPIKSLSAFPLTLENFKRVAELAPLYNAANTNLKPFMSRGGKLLMWHGLADDSVSPTFSLAYYQGVVSELGQSSVDSFLKLFLLPGVGHCGGGNGFDQINLLTPLMAWVEEHQAPQQIIAGQPAQKAPEMAPPVLTGKTGTSAEESAQAHFHGVQQASAPFASPAVELKATRPIYPYPYIAKYNGTGDPNSADSYQPMKSAAFSNLRFGKPAIDFIGPDNQRNYQVRDGKLTPVQ
jgi:Tannase and feruloyl esterase.